MWERHTPTSSACGGWPVFFRNLLKLLKNAKIKHITGMNMNSFWWYHELLMGLQTRIKALFCEKWYHGATMCDKMCFEPLFVGLFFMLFSFVRAPCSCRRTVVCVCEVVRIAIFYVCAHVVCITSCLIMYILTICGPIKSCLQNQGVESWVKPGDDIKWKSQ